MKKYELENLGVPDACLDLGMEFCKRAAQGGLFKRYKPAELIAKVVESPQDWFNDSIKKSGQREVRLGLLATRD